MAWKSGARARLCPLGSPHHEYGRLLVQGGVAHGSLDSMPFTELQRCGWGNQKRIDRCETGQTNQKAPNHSTPPTRSSTCMREKGGRAAKAGAR